MITSVTEVPLAVGESLVIPRNRFGSGMKDEKRICIVTGTHGDELEGQYVAWKLASILRSKPGHLRGTVDIYPAINPLGICTMSRGMPQVDLDLNRIFPGNPNGNMSE